MSQRFGQIGRRLWRGWWLIYAQQAPSGTPTHRRDFAVAAAALASLFDRRPEPLLVIVGALDLAAYPELARHAPRIETRLRLPLHDLFGEVARFDVNLAPLELGNLFCEAKSPLRLLAAAAVEVPSVDTALRRHPARLDRLHCRRRRGLGGRARMPAG